MVYLCYWLTLVLLCKLKLVVSRVLYMKHDNNQNIRTNQTVVAFFAIFPFEWKIEAPFQFQWRSALFRNTGHTLFDEKV